MRHKLVIIFLGMTVLVGVRGVYGGGGSGVPTDGSQVVLGMVTYQNTPVTETKFTQKVVQEVEVLPYTTQYQETEELELGQSRVERSGQDGWVRKSYRLTYWEGQIQDRVLVGEEREEPVTEVVWRGTKIVPRDLSTPEGEFRYFQSREMFATSYDGNCRGCNGITYTGSVVGRGVCAVDPGVIPLGTRMYVEGYGLCRAEDIGGKIRGDRIDLGFTDVGQGFWSARWTRVYLLMD